MGSPKRLRGMGLSKGAEGDGSPKKAEGDGSPDGAEAQAFPPKGAEGVLGEKVSPQNRGARGVAPPDY